ncbi:MAG: GDSL-type esterase/lipase family protein [Kiritimatiellae bacterium]|nr:GDSL-type esterase/lipase family protein [Kiritimatiellia bacterium]
MKYRRCLVGMAALLGWTAFAVTAGWEDNGADRVCLPPQKVVWTGNFAQVKSELRDGAEGSVTVCEWNGRPALKIAKTNDRGMIVVTAPAFAVKPGAKLRTYANCACSDADPTMAEGYLRLYGKREDLSYFKGLDGRGPGGPRMQKMVNANPGKSVRKLAHRLADDATGTEITPAIVVSGTPSTSFWSDWGVEDKVASDKAWSQYRKSLEPADVTRGMISEAEFEARLAAERDHTARIEKREGFARLLIDGLETAPVIFRGQTQKDGKITYAGGLHDREGVHLQSTSVRFGRTPKDPLGIWTKDGFDAKAGAALVKTTMRLAPEAQMILAVNLSAYPEWCARHPGEEWMLADGRKVYGSNVHADFQQKGTPPEGKWFWPSYHSRAWRDEVKAHLTTFIDELKRQGLSKRVVGVHLSGYHDAQFATRHPDFSPSAVAAFRAWQQQTLGTVKWQDAPAFGKGLRLDPEKEAHQAAYLRFVKQGPFHMQEDIARHIKRCFGKDIVVGRYCMGWGAAAFNNALDLWPFVNSDAIDFLVAQPNYANRIPGVALGSRIPTRSFHEHGKLFVNEFDLRTYGGVHGGESELRVMGLSQATDFPMWQTIHRKCAGQMIAQRMGWWYLDMSGTWFSPREIVKDIAAVNQQVQAAEACGKAWNEWRASVALAIDEDGLLHYNTIGNYYVKDESNIRDQLADLAGAGVPMDVWMAEDFLANPDLVAAPKRAFGYKVVVFAGMYDRDARRQALIATLEKRGVTCVFLSAEKPLTPSAFAQIVREAGGYVPTSTGLQVDMSGNFISVHALRPGKYAFTLPKKCAAYNMRNGRREANGEKLALDLSVGETCWFALGPHVVDPKEVPALDAANWKAQREEVKQWFLREQFGVRPVERPADLAFAAAPDQIIMGGRAIHRAVTISATGPHGPFSFEAHAYLPKGAVKVPGFVYIYLGRTMELEGFDPNAEWPGSESCPVGELLGRGFALVTFRNWDVAMDDKNTCFSTGVFKAWGPTSDAERGPSDWGAISAWAWGASRVLDWVETQAEFDATRMAVIGHSRGGKTALCAGVTDTRFALACVNDSGCSGAKLNHIDLPDSEHIDRINTVFPHWFAKNWRAYGADEAAMPRDQHQLVALMAPRKVAIGSATRDAWAGQVGEFAAARLASPAWTAYGKKGLSASAKMPAPECPLSSEGMAYHIRSGKHALTRADWRVYMDCLGVPPTVIRVGADEKGALIPAAPTAADAALAILHRLEEMHTANRKVKVILQACDAEGRGQGLCRAAGKFARLDYVSWQGPKEMTNHFGQVETEGDPRSDTFYSKGLGKNWWLTRLARNREQIAASSGQIDLVMMGDSITHFWERRWTNSWEQFTAARKVLNCGYAGDKVEHLLWRAENGELDGYTAKAVSILIGTNNNTSPTSDPAKVAAGIRKVLDVVRAKQPQAKILLCAIPPRGRGEKDAKHHEARARNEKTNALIREFADGRQIVWVDFRQAFVDPATGWADANLMPDRIHPSDKGYELVRAALEPELNGLR